MVNFNAPSRAAAHPADWAVLVYTSSSHDLEEHTQAGLQELSQEIRDCHIPVAVQWGRAGAAERIEVSGGQLERVESVGTTDMSHPATLSDFLSWGMKRYPARHYAVVVGGHGAGFLGCVTNTERRKMMRLPELREALEKAPFKPEMMAFNTCLMACTENLSELNGQVGHIVAAQAGEHDKGMPLGAWIHQLEDCADGGQAARKLVDECRNTPHRTPHMSALQLRGLPAYEQAIDTLGAEILAHPDSREVLQRELKQVAGLWEEPRDNALYRQVDAGLLARRWAQQPELPESLRSAARQVAEKADEMVTAKSSQTPGSGVSIFAPDQPWQSIPLFDAKMSQVYGNLQLSQKTQWDEAIDWLSSARS